MPLPMRRGVIITIALIVFAALATNYVIRNDHVTSSVGYMGAYGNLTSSISLLDVKGIWKTKLGKPRFAYVQYVTEMDYLCNAFINFNRLKSFDVKSDLVLIFPKDWSDKESNSREARAIRNLHAEHPDIVLRPYELMSTFKGDSTWRNTLREYARVLAFDSDALVLANMDSVFLSPETPFAAPRAYWLIENDPDACVKHILSSQIMLIQPSDHLYKLVRDEAEKSADFDMEVVNTLFKDSAMLLPHRRFNLLTGEFRRKDHTPYMGPEAEEDWNPIEEVKRAYFVHFSDWPLPKPWRKRTDQQWQAAMPECPVDEESKLEIPRCADQLMWTQFYSDYTDDKETYCKILAT